MNTNNFDLSNADMSGSNNAFGSKHFEQHSGVPRNMSRAELSAELVRLGVSDSQIDGLFVAMDEDGYPERGRLGARVREWLQEQAQLAIGTTVTMTTGALLSYYGLANP